VDRRSFLGTLAVGLVAASLAAEAQHVARVYTVGFWALAFPTPHKIRGTRFSTGCVSWAISKGAT
jgi:hypothetical protein